jgi:hypothetical protein
MGGIRKAAVRKCGVAAFDRNVLAHKLPSSRRFWQSRHDRAQGFKRLIIF